MSDSGTRKPCLLPAAAPFASGAPAKKFACGSGSGRFPSIRQRFKGGVMNDLTLPSAPAEAKAQSWKVTFPCTRAEAEALDGDIAAFALMDRPPVLMTSEAEPDNEQSWRLDAYFEGQPGPAAIRLLRSLVPSAAGIKPVIEQLPDEDWVTLSQQGLEPVTAGRFHARNLAGAPDRKRVGKGKSVASR